MLKYSTVDAIYPSPDGRSAGGDTVSKAWQKGRVVALIGSASRITAPPGECLDPNDLPVLKEVCGGSRPSLGERPRSSS
jgi:hypothetical protein